MPDAEWQEQFGGPQIDFDNEGRLVVDDPVVARWEEEARKRHARG